MKDEKQTRWLDAMAAHVLQHGLTSASLRPLAKAAGTSDRMLIYHFGSKEGLIDALLRHLAAQLAQMLTQALPAERFSTMRECAEAILALMRTPAAKGYAQVFLEIVAAAGRGQPGYRETGHDVLAFFRDWLAVRVPASETDPGAAAQALLVLVEGSVILDAVGHGGFADEALVRFFPHGPRR